MGPDGSERRRAVRIAERLSVAYRRLHEGTAAPKTTAGETLNLSASGLCLVAPERLERESNVALEITLAGQSQPVVAMGRVVWCDEDDGGGDAGSAAGPERYRVGICFTWLREVDRAPLEVIAEYVRHRTDDRAADA